MANILGVEIERLAHAAFRIQGNGKIIYMDPFQLKQSYNDADIIFISHEHFDHCSIEDLRKVIKDSTLIVCPPDCQSKLSGMKFKDTKLAIPGTKGTVEGIAFYCIPAYNTNKKFHPRANDWIGYIITVNGKNIYHCGDTDVTSEMKALKNIDIALMAVSGTYVMTAPEAAQAVNSFHPKVAIPMHYGEIVGTIADAEKFKELAKCEVEIL
ncbi:MBL fold metallo-hydrolase [Candidatus Woesearchaeota archaeon]|nr:MBL fold metallo-hydrolase [Candidatus Woesearchaeota archaeon]